MAKQSKLSLFAAPRLTPKRMVLAMGIAVAADGLQILLTPIPGADQIIDIITALLISWTIGFHILLLPTFVVELVPVLDDLPTWIACTAAVIALRKREQSLQPPADPSVPTKPAPPEKPVIDV